MTTRNEGGSSQTWYLEERVARSLPELRLTRLFFPARAEQVLAQLVLYDELRELPLIADSGVAMTKLGWWHEEWKRLREGTPRHPVTQAIADRADTVPDLEPALKVMAWMLSGSPPETRDELSRWLDGLARPLAALEPGADTRAAWRRIWLIAWLADLETLARAGRAPWSMDLAASEQLVREAVGSGDARARAATGLWQALAGDPPPPAGHASVYLRLREVTALRQVHGRPPAGPWRQLWTAWAATRRARRAS